MTFRRSGGRSVWQGLHNDYYQIMLFTLCWCGFAGFHFQVSICT